MTGRPSPELEKPVPVRAAALTVTAEVPVDVSVSDCVVALFTATVPNARLAELRLNVGNCEPSCNVKAAGGPKALAVNVAVCAVLTEEIVALKFVVFAPDVTITEAGTLTAALLLARFTVTPLAAAVAFSFTVQLSVPVPVIFGMPVP